MPHTYNNRCHVEFNREGRTLEVVFYDATNTMVDIRWYDPTTLNSRSTNSAFHNDIRQWVRDGIL